MSEHRHAPALLTLAVGLLACLGIGLLLPWQPMPEPVPASDLFTTAELARAERYAGGQRALSLLSLVVSLTTLGLLLWRPNRLLGRADTWWGVLRTVLTVQVVLLAVSLPVAAVRHARAVTFEVSTQPWGSWLLDVGKAQLLQGLAWLAVIAVLLAAKRRWRHWWPVVSAAILSGLVALMTLLFPVLVEPMFANFAPLEDRELAAQITELAEREGVVVDEVLVNDASLRTNTYNAYVSGLGPTQRVVLYDTLVEGAERDETLAVVAHELAHAQGRDVLLGTSLGIGGLWVGVGLLGLWVRYWADASRTEVALRLIGLIVLASLMTSPIANAASRQLENRADQVAVAALPDAGSFSRLQVSLAKKSLADPSPPKLWQWWFGSHPTVLERAARSS